MTDEHGGVMASSSKRKKPRLGRGLSSLIGVGSPVQVEFPDANADAKPNPESNGGAPPAGAAPGPAHADPAPSAMQQGQPASAPQPTPLEPGQELVRHLAIAAIRPNPLQPRRVFREEALKELADSIRRAGVMQPIVVREVAPHRAGSGGPPANDSPGNARSAPRTPSNSPAGVHTVQYELIAGERRWRAAALAGLQRVPAVVRDVSDEVSAEWALIENVQREDLGPLEKGEAFRLLSERFGLTQDEIATRVGLDRSSVSNLIRLTELEEEIRAMLDSGELGLGHGKALLAFAPGPRRVKLARQAARDGLSVRSLEEAVRAGGEALMDVVRRAEREMNDMDERGRPASIRELEKQLGEHLGTKVKIKGGRDWKRGKIVIEFFDLDQFDGLMEKFGFQMME